MIGQMKHILAAEQKKTDFKPEDENNVLIQYTNVSKPTANVVCYIQGHFENNLNDISILIHSIKYLHLNTYELDSFFRVVFTREFSNFLMWILKHGGSTSKFVAGC